MKRLPKIKCSLIVGSLLLLITHVSMASDLIEPTRTLGSPTENSGKLSVFSEPPGLDVDLDGSAVGKTPIVDLKVAPGRHIIRLKDVETEINAESGKSIKLSWFKGAFIRVPVEKQEARVKQSEAKDEPSKMKMTEQSDDKKEEPQPLYFPLNPGGPIF